MEFNYCPVCGAALQGRILGDEGEVPYCEACSRPWFSFSYPCVICLAVDENGDIALIREVCRKENYRIVNGKTYDAVTFRKDV